MRENNSERSESRLCATIFHNVIFIIVAFYIEADQHEAFSVESIRL